MYYLLKWIKLSVKNNTLKNTGKWKINAGKGQGILSVRKSGNHDLNERHDLSHHFRIIFQPAFSSLLKMIPVTCNPSVICSYVLLNFTLSFLQKNPFNILQMWCYAVLVIRQKISLLLQLWKMTRL